MFHALEEILQKLVKIGSMHDVPGAANTADGPKAGMICR